MNAAEALHAVDAADCHRRIFLVFAMIVLLPQSPGHSMDLQGWLLLYIPFGVFVFIYTFRKVK